MEGLSDALGFSYALLMGNGRGRYWRIYMGGSEDYRLMLPEEIIALAETLGPNQRAVAQLRDAFNTTSIYLWCVDEDEVIMQTLGKIGSREDPIRADLSNVMKPKPLEDGRVSTDGMKNSEDKTKPFWDRIFDFIIR